MTKMFLLIFVPILGLQNFPARGTENLSRLEKREDYTCRFHARVFMCVCVSLFVYMCVFFI